MSAAGEIKNIGRITFGKQERCETGTVIRRCFPAYTVTAVAVYENQRHRLGIDRNLITGKSMIAMETLTCLILFRPTDEGIGIECSFALYGDSAYRKLTLFLYYNALGKRR